MNEIEYWQKITYNCICDSKSTSESKFKLVWLWSITLRLFVCLITRYIFRLNILCTDLFMLDIFLVHNMRLLCFKHHWNSKLIYLLIHFQVYPTKNSKGEQETNSIGIYLILFIINDWSLFCWYWCFTVLFPLLYGWKIHSFSLQMINIRIYRCIYVLKTRILLKNSFLIR